VADQVTEVFEVFDTSAVREAVPADGTVAAAGVTVTTTAGETVTWKVAEPETLLESVTVTPKLDVPVAVGLPEIVPLDALRTRPAGSSPDEVAYVYGAVPPPTASGTL
jgi:hypothetical protein